MGSVAQRKKSIAKRALEILKIETKKSPVKVLKELNFLIMSSAELKISEIVREINSLLEQERLVEAEKKLKDLEDWYEYNKYWD